MSKLFEYFRHNKPVFKKDDVGFIKFFFPEIIILDQLYDLDDNLQYLYIVKSDEYDYLLDLYPNLILGVCGTRNVVSSKGGFLDVLVKGLNLKLPDFYKDSLLKMDDSKFWVSVKHMYLYQTVSKLEDSMPQNGSSYKLLTMCFKNSYLDMYHIWDTSNEPYHKTFSILLTMLGKIEQMDHLTLSDNYRSTLSRLVPYLPNIKKALYIYLLSNGSEIAFLDFLYGLSKDSL